MKNFAYLPICREFSYKLATLLLLIAPVACSTPSHQRFLEGKDLQSLKGEPKKIWSIDAPGLISDLDIATETGDILLGTIGDPERPNSNRSLSLWSKQGKKVWEVPLHYPSRQQSIAADASQVVVGDYENQLIAYGRKGETLWRVEAHCKPTYLGRTSVVLCLRDDDPVTDVPFELISPKGKKIYKPEYHADGLFARVSQDGSHFAVVMRGGEVALYQVTFAERSKEYRVELYWKKKVSGEIVDLDLETDLQGKPQAIVYSLSEGVRSVTWVGASGKTLAPLLDLTHSPLQIAFQKNKEHSGASTEASSLDSGVFTYSNGPQGQWVSLFRLVQKSSSHADEWPLKWKEAWRRGVRGAAEYMTDVQATRGGGVLMGWERREDGKRTSEIAGLSAEGKVNWVLPIESSLGAYLFRFTVSPQADELYVATDDGVLSAYRLE